MEYHLIAALVYAPLVLAVAALVYEAITNLKG
jgi:hypothetical protein